MLNQKGGDVHQRQTCSFFDTLLSWLVIMLTLTVTTSDNKVFGHPEIPVIVSDLT